MKYIMLFLLASLCLHAQDYDKEALRKLALMTIDVKDENEHRDMLASFSVVPEKKEDFKKEYDAGIETFVVRLEEYYKSNYTPAEVLQLVVFYETPTGKKIAKDCQLLIDGSFPKGKEWDMQLYEMKKKDKEAKKKGR